MTDIHCVAKLYAKLQDLHRSNCHLDPGVHPTSFSRMSQGQTDQSITMTMSAVELAPIRRQK